MCAAQPSGEKKLTLLLLCWLFGIFGVHRFYIGKRITGGFQLAALGLTGALGFFEVEILSAVPLVVLLLWWIIDIMRIIMGKFTDKEGRPITDWA